MRETERIVCTFFENDNIIYLEREMVEMLDPVSPSIWNTQMSVVRVGGMEKEKQNYFSRASSSIDMTAW